MATPTFIDWLGDFTKGYLGERPIYVDGVKIGYWKPSQNNLCGGNAFIYAPYLDANKKPSIPPQRWITKDDLWRDVSVSSYCIGKGITPSWAQVTGNTVVITTPTGQTQTLTKTDTGAITSENPLSGIGLPVALTIGAGSFLALVLLMRR